MKIFLVSFGKPRLPGILETILEYEKRIPKWNEFQAIELKASKQDQEHSKESDSKQIITWMASLKGSTRLWALDENGASLSTKEWASGFVALQGQAINNLVVCLGNSLGIGEDILKRADKKISFGKQTLGHEIARLVATEQIYRALSVIQGHPYHHE